MPNSSDVPVVFQMPLIVRLSILALLIAFRRNGRSPICCRVGSQRPQPLQRIRSIAPTLFSSISERRDQSTRANRRVSLRIDSSSPRDKRTARISVNTPRPDRPLPSCYSPRKLSRFSLCHFRVQTYEVVQLTQESERERERQTHTHVIPYREKLFTLR